VFGGVLDLCENGQWLNAYKRKKKRSPLTKRASQNPKKNEKKTI